MIYETKVIVKISMAASGAGAVTVARAAMTKEVVSEWVVYWSKELKTKITHSNLNEPIFVIGKEGKFWNVIIGERIGWIIAEDWLELKPLERETNDRK